MQVEVAPNPHYVITLTDIEADALLAFFQSNHDTWGMHNTAYCVRKLYDKLRELRTLALDAGRP